MKIINTLIGTVIITAEILLLYGLYFLFYPFKPVTFNRDKFEVVTTEVKRGESLIYKANVCKNMDIATEITRSFNGEAVYLLPTTVSTRPEGCSINNVAVPIPEAVVPGKYYLRTRFVYKLNALRTITAIHDSEEFTVVEK